MKIKIERLGGPPITFEAFADQHDLVMIVVERPRSRSSRFSAHFDRVEIKSDVFLVSSHGSGASVDLAIADYKDRIRGERLVKNAFDRKTRHDFQAPNEWEDVGDKTQGRQDTDRQEGDETGLSDSGSR